MTTADLVFNFDEAESGRVVVTYPRVLDESDVEVYPSRRAYVVITDGVGTLQDIRPTDDAGLNPQDAPFHIEERLSGWRRGTPGESYYINPTVADIDGGEINAASLTPVPGTTGTVNLVGPEGPPGPNLHYNVQAGPYNAAGNGTADDTEAIQEAIDDCAADGGGVVYFPPGTYKITAQLDAASNVTCQGAGMGVSIIDCVSAGSMRAFGNADTTPEDPLVNAVWRDLTVDLAGVEGSGSKAFYIPFMQSPKWISVEVLNSPATGFGCDFMVDYLFAWCRAINCGRLLDFEDPGASGFGIGTGEYPVEDGTLFHCYAEGNTNYGIFFEQQPEANGNSPYFSKGAKVIGCYTSGNGHGIGECGVLGLEVTGSWMIGNSYDGFNATDGTAGLGIPGQQGRIHDNWISDNARNGIFIDYTERETTATSCRYLIHGNKIDNNGSHGIAVSADDSNVHGLSIYDNDVSRNGGYGIRLARAGTATFFYPRVTGNRCRDNGTTSTAAGIGLLAPITGGVIESNRCYDNRDTKLQDYGIEIGAVTLHNTHVRDNHTSDNLTKGFQDGSTRTGALADETQFPTTRTLNSGTGGTFSVLGLQNNDPSAPDDATRVYIVPRDTPTTGTGAALKVFADPYFDDSTNYRDFGLFFSADLDGETGTNDSGAFWLNSKGAGTHASDPPDVIVGFQDQYVAGRWAYLASGQQVLVIGAGEPDAATHVSAVLAEVQGDLGFNSTNRKIRWYSVAGTTLDNAMNFGTDHVAITVQSSERVRFTTAGMRFNGASGPLWRTGAGTPEGSITGPVGSLYTRTDGGANTTLYVKESGTGNTGWIAK